MASKTKLTTVPSNGLRSVITPNADLGIEILKRSEIPSPKGRGRIKLVPQLSVSKVLHESLENIAKNGIGISEEAAGFNLMAPITVKEAEKIGLKNVAVSFFVYVKKQLEEYQLTDKVTIIRREGGKKLYLAGAEA